mgnify:CR=1 FL=1
MCIKVSFTVTPPLTVRASTLWRDAAFVPNQYSASGRGRAWMKAMASSSWS